MLSNESQALLRNAELFDEGNWLLVNPSDSAVFQQIKNAPAGFHQYFDQYCLAKNSSKSTQQFGAFLDSHHPYDGAVIYWPKAKQQGLMLTQHIASKLLAGGTLVLVGDNKSGLKSAVKHLSKAGINAQKIDSARHCSVYACQIDSTIPDVKVEDWLQEYSVEINGIKLILNTLPGVFSSDGLDDGTELLLNNLNINGPKRILDFACGNGVIACYLKKRYPDANVQLSDINGLALYCAQINLGKNQVDGTIIPSNVLDNVTDRFDAIVSNPPFHTGLKTDYDITSRFLTSAKEHLNSAGSLTLVANRFLPYPDQIESCFGKLTTIAKNNKFSVYQANKN